MDCVFCRIVDGQIPCKKIAETPDTLSILDAFPLTLGHVLVVPKRHYEKIQDIPMEENADLFESVRQASARVDQLTGATLLAVHNGKGSGQEVPHVHVHLVPRSAADGAGAIHSMFAPMEKPSDAQMGAVCRRLRH